MLELHWYSTLLNCAVSCRIKLQPNLSFSPFSLLLSSHDTLFMALWWYLLRCCHWFVTICICVFPQGLSGCQGSVLWLGPEREALYDDWGQFQHEPVEPRHHKVPCKTHFFSQYLITQKRKIRTDISLIYQVFLLDSNQIKLCKSVVIKLFW